MRNKDTAFRPVFLLLLFFAIFLVSACGPTVIKGRPPFINISDMKLQGETLSASFAISNQNEEEMTNDETPKDEGMTNGGSSKFLQRERSEFSFWNTCPR